MQHDLEIDVSDTCCSAPIIRLSKEFKTRNTGEIALIIANKESVHSDITSYCATTGHSLVEEAKDDDTYRFWIRIR